MNLARLSGMKPFKTQTAIALLVCSLPAISSAELYYRQSTSYVTLGNDQIEVTLSAEDGTIRHLLNKADTVDYCNQVVETVWPETNVPVGERIGGVMIHDDLARKTFSDLQSDVLVSNLNVSKGEKEIVCTFEKVFEGADFTVKQSFTVQEDHIRWEVQAQKIRGGDRSLRLVQLLPLPTWGYTGWAPIAEAPFGVNPWVPFQINYGQADGGPVGNEDWRTCIPMLVFWNQNKRNALCLVNPFELPAVRVRYRNSVGIAEDFHWNSRNYSMSERPYLQVISEYLGLRDNRNAKTGLLITLQPRDWRASLGWVYNRYPEYFDPAEGFGAFDGNYVIDHPCPDTSNALQEQARFKKYYDNQFVRWWEMHGHFPKYGQMIPDGSVRRWICGSHPRKGYTNSRQKIAMHAAATKAAGVGCFIYYNTTESEWWYAREKYPESIARDENGNTINAYKGMSYPDSQACWLMNSDPETPFGKDLADQAQEMLQAYPGIAGFFWDVYGRSYRFDFAHDDGITMVNNRPAYYPEFMYERMMEQKIGPLLHKSGRFITCNKPTMITGCKGIDGIMAKEDTPDEDVPAWLVAQSYLCLTRHGMILDGSSWQHPERTLLNCLRYGFFYSAMRGPEIGDWEASYNRPYGASSVAAQKEKALKIEQDYLPLFKLLKGRKWIFHPQALDLPPMTDGNVFRLEDGSVMAVMVSLWRELNNVPGTVPELSLTVRVQDAAEFNKFTLYQPDKPSESAIRPIGREGDALVFRVPEHGKASVIVMRK